MTVADAVLAALADPTRRSLLDRLAVHGAATATALAAELPVTRQAVVQHLAVLDRAGLVAGARRGRERWFEVRTGPLGETARWLDDLAHEWDARLLRIRALAESAVPGEPDPRPGRGGLVGRDGGGGQLSP